MSLLRNLFAAELTIFGQHILWREIIGNAFGFASAIGGLRRRVWAWPLGIAGNVLLFTVFFGVAFDNPQAMTLFGQAGRQIFFIATSIYGWWRWYATSRSRAKGTPAIGPDPVCRTSEFNGLWPAGGCSSCKNFMGGWHVRP